MGMKGKKNGGQLARECQKKRVQYLRNKKRLDARGPLKSLKRSRALQIKHDTTRDLGQQGLLDLSRIIFPS